MSGGDGSEAYKECVKYKYKVERLDRYRESKGQPGRNFGVPTSYEFVSGQPANTVLFEDPWGGAYSAEEKADLRIDGRDSNMFSVMLGDLVPFEDPDGAEQTEDFFVFDQTVVASRPLPAGGVPTQPPLYSASLPRVQPHSYRRTDGHGHGSLLARCTSYSSTP